MQGTMSCDGHKKMFNKLFIRFVLLITGIFHISLTRTSEPDGGTRTLQMIADIH